MADSVLKDCRMQHLCRSFCIPNSKNYLRSDCVFWIGLMPMVNSFCSISDCNVFLCQSKLYLFKILETIWADSIPMSFSDGLVYNFAQFWILLQRIPMFFVGVCHIGLFFNFFYRLKCFGFAWILL